MALFQPLILEVDSRDPARILGISSQDRQSPPGACVLPTSFPVSSFSFYHQSECDSGEVTEVMGCFVLMWDFPLLTGGRKQILEPGWPNQALRPFDLRPEH